jgi:hypothetical protein
MLADRSGLIAGLSRVLARRGFTPVHDRGRVLADLAVAVACGARDIELINWLTAQNHAADRHVAVPGQTYPRPAA